jgi:outer membrane protein assembly factor BamD
VLLKRGRYEEGRKKLRILEENLPSSAEFPAAKLLLADSFFYAKGGSFPEALVEYQSFLTYFPRHERRDYALYRAALCHYATIESAERDQVGTRRALEAFQQLLKEAPGSVYATDAKAKVTQCWRRLAEHELGIGIFYVKSFHFPGAERRLKTLMETYPEYVDRERAYYYLGETMRRKMVPQEDFQAMEKEYLAKVQKESLVALTREEATAYGQVVAERLKASMAAYRTEAKGYYQKLVESYPQSEWARRASDRLVEMGSETVKEELDS